MSIKPVVVVGAGGHASVVIDALRLSGRSVVGVISPSTPKRELGVTWLGQTLDVVRTGDVDLALGVGSIGVGEENRRPSLFEEGLAAGFEWTEVRHPSAIVASNVVLGRGVQLMAGVIVGVGARLDDNVLLNTRACVDHDCRIEAHCHLAPGVVLSGSVRIGRGSHLGTGAVVIQGIEIGAGTLVVAGATMTRNAGPHSVVRRGGK